MLTGLGGLGRPESYVVVTPKYVGPNFHHYGYRSSILQDSLTALRIPYQSG